MAGRLCGWIKCIRAGRADDYLGYHQRNQPRAGEPGAAQQITQGPDGALWFTEGGVGCCAQIGRVTTAAVITQYPLPESNGSPLGITAGSDGALWFTEPAIDKIGRISTAGVITEYSLPTNSGPAGITTGPDGALWFTEPTANQIGRMTTTGAVTDYRIPTPRRNPFWITTGPDGALWFTETRNSIGRISTVGDITEYPVPNGLNVTGITAAPDGALWFTLSDQNAFGRITTGGTVTEYQLSPGARPGYITAGPDGALWLAENNGMVRAPACALGFSASFASGTLTMNFDLGIDTPATFNIILRNPSGPVSEPVSTQVGPFAHPHAFALQLTSVPNLGILNVRPILAAGPGQPICSAWQNVDTSQ